MDKSTDARAIIPVTFVIERGRVKLIKGRHGPVIITISTPGSTVSVEGFTPIPKAAVSPPVVNRIPTRSVVITLIENTKSSKLYCETTNVRVRFRYHFGRMSAYSLPILESGLSSRCWITVIFLTVLAWIYVGSFARHKLWRHCEKNSELVYFEPSQRSGEPAIEEEEGEKALNHPFQLSASLHAVRYLTPIRMFYTILLEVYNLRTPKYRLLIYGTICES